MYLESWCPDSYDVYFSDPLAFPVVPLSGQNFNLYTKLWKSNEQTDIKITELIHSALKDEPFPLLDTVF